LSTAKTWRALQVKVAVMERRAKRSAHTELFGSKELTQKTRCAVIVAHPNDEVVGAGGLISRLSNVTVLHITDGVPRNGYADAAYVDRSESVRARRRECREALALANVNPEQIVEFGVACHQSPLKLEELARRVASFLQSRAPDVVLTHPYEGGHPDHDATAFATHAAIQLLRRNGFRPPALFEIALHPSRDGKGRVLDFLPSDAAEMTTLLLDKKARDLKRQMFACFAAPPEVPRENPFGLERFRRPPHYDLAAPPNGGKIFYENAAADAATWQSLVNEAWSRLFPDEQTTH
jgi:N-acetylglucosamine malate deacetylase 2